MKEINLKTPLKTSFPGASKNRPDVPVRGSTSVIDPVTYFVTESQRLWPRRPANEIPSRTAGVREDWSTLTSHSSTLRHRMPSFGGHEPAEGREFAGNEADGRLLEAPLKNSALLVIDVQRYFFERGASAFLEDAPIILPNILKLVEAYREARLPVIFTRHAHKKNEPTGQMGKWWNEKLPWDGSDEAELVKEIVLTKDELVITKTKYSAFEGTTLENYLKGRGVSTVVLCGVMTNLCVETTARHAFIKDFEPVVISEACAANTNRHHNASILNLSYGFALIENTNSVIRGIKACEPKKT